MEKPATLILCGGKSARMGRDKAFVEVRGVPMIERVIAVAREISDEIRLVAPEAARVSGLGLPVLTEERVGIGPIEAMRVGLSAIEAPAAWVLACDLPNLAPGPLLRMQALLTPGADAVVPRDAGGRDHPLCGLYRRGCCVFFDRAINSGETAIYRALSAMSVIHPAPGDIDAGRDFLDNLNTPEDLE